MPSSPSFKPGQPWAGRTRATQSVAVTDAVFAAEFLSPGRLQASFEYRRTDAARFGDLDMSLRAALSEGLSEALDKELIDQIVADVARVDAAAVDTFATYRARMVYGLLDGRFAKMESDVRLLMGAATAVDASSDSTVATRQTTQGSTRCAGSPAACGSRHTSRPSTATSKTFSCGRDRLRMGW